MAKHPSQLEKGKSYKSKGNSVKESKGKPSKKNKPPEKGYSRKSNAKSSNKDKKIKHDYVQVKRKRSKNFFKRNFYNKRTFLIFSLIALSGLSIGGFIYFVQNACEFILF